MFTMVGQYFDTMIVASRDKETELFAKEIKHYLLSEQYSKKFE